MMMGGMAVIWLIILVVLAVRAVGPLLATRSWPGVLPPGRERKPDELARERYARGEISWPEYQDALINLLQDRYVRGELELAEYEERTSRVLDEAVPGSNRDSEVLKATAVGDQLKLSGERPLPKATEVDARRRIT